MSKHRLAFVSLLLLTAPLLGQAPPVEPTVQPPITIPAIIIPEEQPDPPQVESTRPSDVATQNDVGVNGELVVSPPVPYPTGIMLRSFTSTPDMFLQLGTSSNTSALNVMSGGGTYLMKLRGNGNLTLGATNELAKFASVNYSDNGRAMYAHQHAQVEATTTQTDYGMYIDAMNTPVGGARNDGSVISMQAQGWNNGAGTVANVFGGRFFAGVNSAATGIVDNAYGLQLVLSAGAGTITNGTGLFINDVPATTGWGLYQSGSNDKNYFAGNVGIGTTAPASALSVHHTAAQAFNATFTTGAGADGGLLFGRTGTNGAAITMRAATDDYLAFAVKKGESLSFTETPDMVIRHDGKIGIGTAAPATALHVVGDIFATGSITEPPSLERFIKTWPSGFLRLWTCSPELWSS